MPIEGKAVLNKDHSFTNFPITISNNVKSSVSNWSVEGNGEQQGTPTPDNIIMPTFCGVRTGNLFPLDINKLHVGRIENDGTIDYEVGTITVGTNSVTYQANTIWRGFYTDYIRVNENEKLTFSPNDSSSISWSCNCYDENNNYLGKATTHSATSSKTFTMRAGTKKVRINVASSLSEYTITNPMLNLGSTALPYEPFGWAEKITCAGQTVPVYLGQAQTMRRVKKLVLTGESNINKNTPSNPNDYLYYLGGVQHEKTDCICSHLTSTDSFPLAITGGVYSKYSSGILYINLSRAVMEAQPSGNTNAGFKEYLASQYAAGTPVTIWYVLLEPETAIVNEPLCKIGDYSDELLSTSEGTPQLTLSTEEPNLISFETNLQPSKFNIKYYEEDYTKIKDIQMQIPTAKTYNYTEYPITINNAVSSNCSIDLFGNSIQNGTPSPDNPIIPEFCGDRTRNLADTEKGGLSASDGSEVVYNTTQSQIRSQYIPCDALTDYIVSLTDYPCNTLVAFYAADKTYISRTSGTPINQPRIISTPENTAFIRIAAYHTVDGQIYPFDVGAKIMFNADSTALPYEPYGYKISFTNSEQTNTVYLGETPTVRRIKCVDLGTLTYTKTASGNFSATLGDGKVVPNSQIAPAICSHFKVVSANAYGSIPYALCVSINNQSDVSINKTGFEEMTVEEFKSAMSGVLLWYALNTEQTTIVNEPLVKIGDYSDELQTTIQLEPFNQNTISINTQLQPSKVSLTYKTKESTDPYKSIKYALDNNNNYLYKSPYFYTWEGIREIVRAGKASQYYPIGSIIYDNFNESTGTAFQVVAYDNHFDPTLTAQGYTHSMTLCELLLTDVITFDAQEAFLYTEVDIPAGTYKFTIPNYDATYGGNKTYYFTSTTTLPSGSQIVMNWPYQQTPKTVTGYVGPNPQTNTTALSGFSALTLTEWVDGTSPEATDLGTIAGPTTQLGTSNYGQMNHIHRARYGSNNYLQSGIRQYINSNSAANTWWTPQTVFDRPYGSRSSAGRLTKLNQDLVSVMATPEIKSRTNSYFETTSLDGTTFTLSTDYTINTDKMFLLSPMEVNFNTTDTTIGTTLDYYIGAYNDKRIKLRKSNNTAYYWWLRTPYPSNAYRVHHVNTSGALNSYSANFSSGAAPACVIQ